MILSEGTEVSELCEIFRRHNPFRDRAKGDHSTGKLIVVCGLPGAGKTTLAKRLEDDLRAIRFCPDEWMPVLGIAFWDEAARTRVEALQGSLGQRLLALGHTVIIEWGTWGRSERDALRSGARALGAAVELRYLDAPLDVLFARIQRRDLEDPPITLDDLRQYAHVFQRPTPEEQALFDAPSDGEDGSLVPSLP